MNLEHEWQNMGAVKAEDSWVTLVVPVSADLKKTLSPLYKIKRALRDGFIWLVLITLMYLAAIWFVESWMARACFVILIGYNGFSFLQAYKLYKSISPQVYPCTSLKAELERNYQTITDWCKMNERTSMYIYPVSILGGFMGGLSMGGIEIMNQLLHKTWVLLTLLGFFVVLMLMARPLLRYMMYKAYGKHMDYLKANIDLLEE